jgi:hypothetical protein
MAAMSVSQLAEQVKNDPALEAKIKADPVGALSEAAYVSDPKFYRMAIGGLIAIILLVVVGGFITELWAVGPKEPKKSLPDGLLALGTTALGVLGGLFISSPTDK